MQTINLANYSGYPQLQKAEMHSDGYTVGIKHNEKINVGDRIEGLKNHYGTVTEIIEERPARGGGYSDESLRPTFFKVRTTI
jgi:hypothetical protein